MKQDVDNNSSYIKPGADPKFSVIEIITLSFVSESFSINGENCLIHATVFNFINSHPFKRVTNISCSLPGSDFVNLNIYYVTGRKVAVLFNKTESAEKYENNFNANNINSDVYFYKLTTGNQTFVRKMMLLK